MRGVRAQTVALPHAMLDVCASSGRLLGSGVFKYQQQRRSTSRVALHIYNVAKTLELMKWPLKVRSAVGDDMVSKGSYTAFSTELRRLGRTIVLVQ